MDLEAMQLNTVCALHGAGGARRVTTTTTQQHNKRRLGRIHAVITLGGRKRQHRTRVWIEEQGPGRTGSRALLTDGCGAVSGPPGSGRGDHICFGLRAPLWCVCVRRSRSRSRVRCILVVVPRSANSAELVGAKFAHVERRFSSSIDCCLPCREAQDWVGNVCLAVISRICLTPAESSGIDGETSGRLVQRLSNSPRHKHTRGPSVANSQPASQASKQATLPQKRLTLPLRSRRQQQQQQQKQRVFGCLFLCWMRILMPAMCQSSQPWPAGSLASMR
ncbi:hypothetical protein IWX49DRAFT_374011 [Phyllosticta citricarpa]